MITYELLKTGNILIFLESNVRSRDEDWETQ